MGEGHPTTKAIYAGVFSNGNTVTEVSSGRLFTVSNAVAHQGGGGGKVATLTLLPGSFNVTSPINVNGNTWTIQGPRGSLSGNVSMYAPLYFTDSHNRTFLYNMNPGLTFNGEGMPVLPQGAVDFTITRSGVSTTGVVVLSGFPQLNPNSTDVNSRVWIDPTTKAIYAGVFSNGNTVTEVSSGRLFTVSNAVAHQGGGGGEGATLTLLPGSSSVDEGRWRRGHGQGNNNVQRKRLGNGISTSVVRNHWGSVSQQLIATDAPASASTYIKPKFTFTWRVGFTIPLDFNFRNIVLDAKIGMEEKNNAQKISDNSTKVPEVKVDNSYGGIDLTAEKLNLQLQNAGKEIKFKVDPAMLAQLQNVPGFAPNVIGLEAMTELSLKKFFGI